jgi:hypothetical protein
MYRRFERVRTVDTAALRTYTIYVMAVLFCMTYVCVCTFSTSYTPRKSKIALCGDTPCDTPGDRGAYPPYAVP